MPNFHITYSYVVVFSPMIIPTDSLDAETLTAIIEQFVLMEGTDYGEQSFTLAQKVAQVRAQLERGEANIVYSERDESVTIVPDESTMG